MIKNIQTKSILSTIKNGPDKYFGLSYNINLYRGCQHGCIYCDSRSSCYGIENLSDILIKENAIVLLDKALKSKRKKGTIGTGSMNDPYMPVEKEAQMTKRALEVIEKYKFPVHIITKSDLVLRDVELLKKISGVYAAVSITITTADDELSKIIEPGAPSTSRRFETIKQLSQQGIYAGITLMPTLPFITDTEENIRNIVIRAKQAEAKYIIPWMGMTLRDVQRDYYYKELDKKFPGLKEKYIKKYGNNYTCNCGNASRLYKILNELCKEFSIPTRMKFFEEKLPQQISMF